MNKIKYLYVLVLFILLVSCNSNKKQQVTEYKKTEIIQFISFPGGTETLLPHLFSSREATILSWVKKLNDSTTQFNYSYLTDEKWEQPKEIITGQDWFVNWADYPMITVNNENVLAHFLKKSSQETFSYDIKLSILPKGTSQWQTQLPLHTDSTKTEHGFVTMLPYKKDSFFITWLDGRNTASENGHAHSGHGGAMTLRAAEVSSNGTVSNNALLDGKTCSCCQTTAAITDNGPIVLYRDRTDKEIRDIAITRQVNGKWTTPKSIFDDGWEINGCPVNGPKVDVIGNSVAVAWFTAANGEPKVKVTFSENSGADFTTPISVSNRDALGRVDIVLLDEDNAIVSWMETVKESTYLKIMKVNKSGTKSASISVSEMSGSRETGFPQMERIGDELYFAWTSLENDTSTIKTAYMPLDIF
ncbi:hypothetical protein [uncultured Kriegella sp.]|uniref:hypothetical protein n=1 Tax=uncultured Kriegella sp. TaxID=1798910 RepID=UPI0030D838C0|tara:strand:+ start:104742 stop:105989 length:1248 start_codon:yes stop_codon:yes gene_type:complete